MGQMFIAKVMLLAHVLEESFPTLVAQKALLLINKITITDSPSQPDENLSW